MTRCWAGLAIVVVLGAAATAAEPDAVEKAQILARIDSLRVHFQALAALDATEAVLPTARRSDDRAFLLALLVRKGMVDVSFGRVREGEPILRECCELATSLGDSLLLCESLRWLGISLAEQNRADDAVSVYEQLRITARACRSRKQEGWALIGLAWQDFLAGHSDESEGRYRDAIACFEDEPDPRGTAWAWNGLGTAVSRLGRYPEALACYEHAARLARARADGYVESLAVNNLGVLAYELGDPGSAMVRFARARTLHEKMGYVRGAITPAVNVAQCQVLLGRYDAAAAAMDSLLVSCREQGAVDLEAMVLNEQAVLESARGRRHHAAALYRRSLALGDDLPLKTRMESWIGLAAIQRELGDPQAALSSLRAGQDLNPGATLPALAVAVAQEHGRCLQELGRHREALSRWQYVTTESARLGLGGYRVLGLARAAASHLALERPDKALTLLREAAAAWEAERELPLDPQWREQRGQAGSLLYTDLATLLLADDPRDPDRTERVRIQQAFDQMQSFKARTLLERMLGPGTGAADIARTQPPVTLADLQSRILADGELLVDLYVGPNVSYLFAVTRQEARAAKLPCRKDLDARLSAYYHFLSDPPLAPDRDQDLAVISETGHELRRTLLGPIDDLIATSTLVFFCPDDRLNLVAPAALCTDDAAPPVWARIPSATVLACLRQHIATAGVISADDAGDTPAHDAILAVAGRSGPDGQLLPGARDEAAALAARYRDVDLRFFGETDTGRSLAVRDLAPYTLLHLAGHASIDDQYPWRSAVACGRDTEGGYLYAADIAGGRLGARLAVLAACESAGGRVLSGEGVLGLASAFLSAGVPAVVATLWPVDDMQTARFMATFYHSLERGEGAAAALADARRAFQQDPVTRDPFFWAGYVVVGDGRIAVPLRRRLPTTPFVLALAAGGVVVLLAGIRRRAAAKL